MYIGEADLALYPVNSNNSEVSNIGEHRSNEFLLGAHRLKMTQNVINSVQGEKGAIKLGLSNCVPRDPRIRQTDLPAI